MPTTRGETDSQAETATAPPDSSAAPPASAPALLSARVGDASHARALARLDTDAARRELLRQIGAGYGNRHAARVLARLIDAEGVKKIAAKASGNAIEAQHVVWELIHLFVPEKGFALSGSRYDAAQVGFRLDGKLIVVGEDVVTRVAKGDVTAVGKELVAALASIPDPFGQLVAGGMSVKDAPTHISLPRPLQEGAEKAWSQSLPGDKSLEKGGILVEAKGGGYIYKPGGKTTSATIEWNRGDLRKGEKLLGVFHTHPYSVKEGGFTDVPHSGQDIANMALQLERFTAVRSGSADFLVATSKEFEARVKAAPSKDKLHTEISAYWQKKFDAATGDVKEKANAATPATCLAYELLYYVGRNGSLAQPRDMVKAYQGGP